MIMLYIGIILTIIGVIMFFVGKSRKKRLGRLTQTQVIPITQVTPDTTTEIEGTILCGQPIMAPYINIPSVYFSYTVEQMVASRTPQGRLDNRWQTVSTQKQSTPFYLQDSSGQIAIYPEHAKIDALTTLVPQGQISQSPMVNISIGNSQKVTVKYLAVNSHAYVAGVAKSTPNGIAIADDCLISYKTEAQYEKSLNQSVKLLSILGIVGMVAGVILAIVGLMK
jgi:hypothetical protein